MLSQRLQDHIEHICSLKDNWDSEGAQGYERSFLEESVKYIPLMEEKALENGIILHRDNLTINPADEGTVDLFWKYGFYTLLANVYKEDGKISACYIGSNKKDGNEIQGEL
ncbi:hypothetical protein CL617_01805 [archaeon]|nr:hypothetical protein [archaeon]|tara:strand:- start:15691 stop:16023 length:333 start_codon:yes stop_codon:yes gene_type:complete